MSAAAPDSGSSRRSPRNKEPPPKVTAHLSAPKRHSALGSRTQQATEGPRSFPRCKRSPPPEAPLGCKCYKGPLVARTAPKVAPSGTSIRLPACQGETKEHTDSLGSQLTQKKITGRAVGGWGVLLSPRDTPAGPSPESNAPV